MSPELTRTFLVVQPIKNPLAKAGDERRAGSITGSGRSRGEGNGNPLQSSLPGKSHRQRNLVGYSPWDCEESDSIKHMRGLSSYHRAPGRPPGLHSFNRHSQVSCPQTDPKSTCRVGGRQCSRKPHPLTSFLCVFVPVSTRASMATAILGERRSPHRPGGPDPGAVCRPHPSPAQGHTGTCSVNCLRKNPKS